MGKITFSIDVEPDLKTGKYAGIVRGLKIAEKIFDKYPAKPILFVTCDCIERFPEIFRNLKDKGWEISLHGYRHTRFDSLSLHEKEQQIKKAIACFKNNLNTSPRGFRAPQHSIDGETLNLLEKYGFKYDSSYAPLNLLQLIFFPEKIWLWLNHFFSPINHYKIKNSLIEFPPSSLILPFVSLLPRVMPKIFLETYIKIIKKTHKKPLFYCHSWDFIKVKNSRIEKLFSHKRFIKNLKTILENENT